VLCRSYSPVIILYCLNDDAFRVVLWSKTVLGGISSWVSWHQMVTVWYGISYMWSKRTELLHVCDTEEMPVNVETETNWTFANTVLEQFQKFFLNIFVHFSFLWLLLPDDWLRYYSLRILLIERNNACCDVLHIFAQLYFVLCCECQMFDHFSKPHTVVQT